MLSNTIKTVNLPDKIVITVGRESVTIYPRLTPAGKIGYQIANYSTGKRRLDSYSNEADARDAATKLAKQLSQRDVLGASMSKEQSIDFASATQMLQPIGISLADAASILVQAVNALGSLSAVAAAVQFYKTKHTPIIEKNVADVVTELLAEKIMRGRGERHMRVLKFRLEKFAESFPCKISSITAAQVQDWIDNHKLGQHSYKNNRAAVNNLFTFATDKKRRYAAENVVADVDKIEPVEKDVEIFSPEEVAKLLASVAEDFKPCLALNLFAGIRGSEIQRLTWDDINFIEKRIAVKVGTSKVSVRRSIDIEPNLLAWLENFKDQKGKIWPLGMASYITRIRELAQSSGVKWKRNAPRHCYISYKVAAIDDVGKVATFAGTSPAVIQRNYLKLVSKPEAEKFFSIFPPKLNQVSIKEKIADYLQKTKTEISA